MRPKMAHASLPTVLRSLRDSRLIHMSTTASGWRIQISSSTSFFISTSIAEPDCPLLPRVQRLQTTLSALAKGPGAKPPAVVVGPPLQVDPVDGDGQRQQVRDA